MTLTGTFISKLIDLAQKETLGDCLARGEDIVVYDLCGGNVDDAYYAGEADGETDLAREVLNNLGITWMVDDDE